MTSVLEAVVGNRKFQVVAGALAAAALLGSIVLGTVGPRMPKISQAEVLPAKAYEIPLLPSLPEPMPRVGDAPRVATRAPGQHRHARRHGRTLVSRR